MLRHQLRPTAAGWAVQHPRGAVSSGVARRSCRALGLARHRYKILEPDPIPFISYPFEWSFSQLKQAAIATLRIQRLAIGHGMTLKDASAYNIQFKGTSPILIDTLSFEEWQEGTPWVAYRQFCQHFLAPLALMSRTEVRLGQLSRLFIDGVPLDLASRLLPLRTRLRPSLLVHLHLHARAQSRHGLNTSKSRAAGFKRHAMMGLIDHLESAIDSLTDGGPGGPWADYYDRTNYSPDAMAEKQRVVGEFVERVRPGTVWDLGANTGAFSRIASAQGAYTIAFDGDATAVERHFLDCRTRQDPHVLPLVMDLANPSGGMGWCHAERLSLIERGPADLGTGPRSRPPSAHHQSGAVPDGSRVLRAFRSRARRGVSLTGRLTGP